MEEINLKKQKINYEGKSIEGVNDFLFKGEYLIPDTHPDVYKILMVDVNPKINSSEAFTDKIFVEGEIIYNVIYVADDEEKNNTYSVSYSDKFNLYIETFGMKKENLYNITVNIINVKSSILNERKINIDGMLKFRALSNDVLEFDVMCDLDEEDDVELLMKDLSVCELRGNFTEELINDTVINVPLDKAAISKILICDSFIYKTECKLLDNKVVYNAYCKVKIVYKGINFDDLCYLEQDIYLTKEVEVDDISEGMIAIDNWDTIGFEYMVDEDESGESRVLNIYINLRCDLKVMNNTTMSVIDDAYSKNSLINLVKNTYKFNNIEAYTSTDSIIKENIETEHVPVNIVYANGNCILTDKKIVEGKVIVDGIIRAEIIYKRNLSEDSFSSVIRDIPFTTFFENNNVKIDMDCVVKCNLESIDAFVEAKTIGVRAIVNVKIYANSEVKRDILVDMYKTQEENVIKDCSCIIYVVGEGDTLWSIAKKYCVSIDDICRVNDLNQDDYIVGCKLLIPYKSIF